jgi:Protein of unknown function (DUF3999)
MTRRHILLFLVLAVLSVTALAADLPSAWRSWRYSRAIDSQHPRILNYIAIDREVFAHSENRLADLRIIDDLGAEQPYELRSRLTVPTPPVTFPAIIRENSFVPGQFTQIVADLGDHPSFYNSIRVQTPESDFINWVEVDASDDAHLWRIVNPRAPISRFRKDGVEGSQTIRYSENNARYLRLRIQEAAHQFPVTGVEVLAYPAAEKEILNSNDAALTRMLSSDSASPPSQTQWTVDLGSTSIPVAEVTFETTQTEFYRAVRLSTSVDAKEWQPNGGGEIYRYAVAGKTEESLRVRCYESWGPRYWRVEILNASDAPLSAVRISLAMSWRFVLFQPKEGRTYRLLYGNARAIAPQYDLARTLHIETNQVMLHPSLGPEELTSNYTDPRPFTERHPNLLWLALAIAVVFLGYAALRALRTPNAPVPQP